MVNLRQQFDQHGALLRNLEVIGRLALFANALARETPVKPGRDVDHSGGIGGKREHHVTVNNRAAQGGAVGGFEHDQLWTA